MTRQAARFLSISGYALNAQKTSHDSTQSGYDVVAEVDTMSCLQTPVGEGAWREAEEELQVFGTRHSPFEIRNSELR